MKHTKYYLLAILALTVTSVLLVLYYKYHYRLYGIIRNFTRIQVDPHCNQYDKAIKRCKSIKVYVLGEDLTQDYMKEIGIKLQPIKFWKPKVKHVDVKMDRISLEYKILLSHILREYDDCFITVEDDNL